MGIGLVWYRYETNNRDMGVGIGRPTLTIQDM